MNKKLFDKIGNVWWDLDENMDVGIECDKPLRGRHYLLTIHTPHGYDGCASEAIEIAEFIIDKIKEE